MSLLPFKSFNSSNNKPLNELADLEDLISGFEDLGLSEKRWDWSQIESAWHKMTWEEILVFTPNYKSRFKTSMSDQTLTATVDEPFLISVQGAKMAETLADQLSKISSTGKGDPSFTMDQILATVGEMTRGSSSSSTNKIWRIFVLLVKEFCEEEDLPNLWVNLKVDLEPERDRPGNSKFIVNVANLEIKPNWDEVADLMCDPVMLKEFKRELYEQVNI